MVRSFAAGFGVTFAALSLLMAMVPTDLDPWRPMFGQTQVGSVGPLIVLGSLIVLAVWITGARPRWTRPIAIALVIGVPAFLAWWGLPRLLLVPY